MELQLKKILTELAKVLPSTPIKQEAIGNTRLGQYQVKERTLFVTVAEVREEAIRALFPSSNVRAYVSGTKMYYIADLQRGQGFKHIHKTNYVTLGIFIPY